MNEPQPVQISMTELAAAIGPEQLLLRLVVLQRRITELEAAAVPVVDLELEGRVVSPEEILAQLDGR